LTRRLVDTAQNILIKEDDCHTLNYEEINRITSTSFSKTSFEEKVFGKILAKDVLV
jgi:DNA-directed RNA polymerase subunit beta'